MSELPAPATVSMFLSFSSSLSRFNDSANWSMFESFVVRTKPAALTRSSIVCLWSWNSFSNLSRTLSSGPFLFLDVSFSFLIVLGYLNSHGMSCTWIYFLDHNAYNKLHIQILYIFHIYVGCYLFCILGKLLQLYYSHS